MDKSYFWFVAVGLSIGTLLIRVSMFFLLSKVSISDRVKSALTYIPVAVLPALALPAVIFHEGVVKSLFELERLVAFVIATLICYKSKNIIISLGSGLLVLFLIKSYV